MGSWRHAMATGMFLKSTPDATDLSAPEPGGRPSDFRRLHGESELTELTPIPCDVFVRYGQRFQKRYVGDVEPARVASVDRGPSAPGFVVGLDDGRQLTAAAVVVATGLNGLAYIPKELLRLTPEGAGAGALVSHTSHHSDLSRYAGQRIAVIGGGQSALESAALLHEAEAHVQVLVRERSVRWGSVPQPNRSWPQRLAQPASPWGRAGHSPRSAGHQAGCGGSRLPPGCCCSAGRWGPRAAGGCATGSRVSCRCVPRAVSLAPRHPAPLPGWSSPARAVRRGWPSTM